MTAAAARSMLGVVELLDADGLADTHGRGAFTRIRDSYIERLKSGHAPVIHGVWWVTIDSVLCSVALPPTG